MIRLKRVYEQPSSRDGLRILVERLWPRGVSKERAQVALWLRDVAPSAKLRTWFGHDPEKWPEFRKRYWAELDKAGDVLMLLRHRAGEGPVTFVYAANDDEHNSARALKEYLEERMTRR